MRSKVLNRFRVIAPTPSFFDLRSWLARREAFGWLAFAPHRSVRGVIRA
jgi:hypothetical protein